MTALSLSRKVAIPAAFQLVYVFTAELFPTSHRSLAICLSVVFRLATISAPYVNDILVSQGEALGRGRWEGGRRRAGEIAFVCKLIVKQGVSLTQNAIR